MSLRTRLRSGLSRWPFLNRVRGRSDDAGVDPLRCSSEELLGWLRARNHPKAGAAERERMARTLRDRPPSLIDSATTRARLKAHAAILAYARSGRLEHLADNAPAAIHQLDEFGRTGQFEFMTLALDHFLERWPAQPVLRKLKPLTAGPGTGDGFRDDGSDVQIARRPGAKTTLLVFTGQRQRFGISIGQLHHFWLSALPANIVYLRDAESRIYLLGIRSLGDMQQTTERLGQILRSLGTERTVCLGNSGGVFPALFYGARLQADLAVCFSGPTSLDIGLAAAADKPVYLELKRLHEEGRIPWPDLAGMIGASSMQVRFFYGAESRLDVLQAEHIGGLPNVSLEPLPGVASHGVIDKIAQQGLLGEIFASCCVPEREPAAPALTGVALPG